MKRLFVILLAAVAAIALAPLTSGAQAVGTFTQIKGDVDVTPPGEAVRPVKSGDEVFVGDIVRSKPASRAEIRFIDDSVLRLAENSRIEITEYMVEPQQSSSVLKLFRGKVQSIVTTTGKNFGAGKRDRYEIHTPTAVCGVRGTNFFTYFLNGVSGAVFQEGSGYGYSNNRPDEVRIIQTGEAMLVTSADEPPEVNPVTGAELGGHAADTSPEDDGDGDGGGEDQGQGGSGDGGSSQGSGGSTGNGTAGASGGSGSSGDGGGGGSSDGGGLGGGQGPPGSLDGNQNLFLAGFSSGGGSGNQNLSQDIIGEVIVQTPDTSSTTTPTTTEATTTTDTTTEATTTTATTTEATTTAATTTEPTTTTTATTTEATTTQETTTAATTTTATTTTATTTAATTTLAPPPPPPPSTKTASGPLGLGELGNASFTASINSATGTGTMSLTGQTSTVMTSGDAFSASFGGSMSDGTAFDGKLQSLLGSYRGLISSLYVNSSGGVGFLTGSLSGEYCFETGSFSATGSLKSSPVLGYAGISPDQLGAALEADSLLFADLPLPILTSVSVVGSINPGGTALSSITGLETTDGGLLGVWAVSTSGGSYGNASSITAWSGHYINSGGDGDGPSLFFMMGDISGTDDLAGHVEIQGDLDYIDLDYRGRIGLTYSGFYDLPGYGGFNPYSSIGVGTYVLEPWHVSGLWGMESFGFSGITGPASVFVDNGGALMPVAHGLGLFGLMPGSGGGFDLLAMGAYLHESEYSIGSGNHIWMSPVVGFTPGIYEGEASGVTLFGGYTGGFWKNGLMEGIGAGLYLHAENSETGPVTIGTLLGDLSGEYFPGVAGSGADGSWRATGGLSFVGTPVTVNDPDESLIQTFLLGDDFQPAFLTGGFGAGGSEGAIYGGAGGELIYASADGMSRFPGFYGLLFGISGEVSAPGEYYDRPAGESRWSAFMGGTGGYGGYGGYGGFWMAKAEGELSQDGGITGSLTGKVLTESMLGSFSGPVYGLWTEGYGGYSDGTWVGESLGSFEGQPLAFGGWTSGALMSYDGEWLWTGGYGEGFLGGTESNLWTGQPVSVTLMGSYDTSEIDGPFLMYGSGFYLEGGSISGGSADQNGAFDGYMVGTWRNGSLKANIVSLYVDPEGTAGYLKGSVSGSYYRDLLMWEADGTLNAYPVLASSGIDPSLLSQRTVMETFGGYSGTGSFDGGGLLQAGFAAGDPVRIEGMSWGIWNAGFGGSYSGTTTGPWKLSTGGYYSGSWSGYWSSGYWMGELSGSEDDWGNLDEWGYADITGSYNGRVLTETARYVFSGDILGTRWNDEGYGGWQSAGIGTYEMTPLSFNGIFHGADIWGKLGGLSNLWTAGTTSNGADFVIIGEYDNLSVSSAFSAEIGSYNPVDYSPTIMNPEDGTQNGAYFGYLTGSVLPNDGMAGSLLALYLDPSGNAGILKGGFTGTRYPGLDMWEADGSIFSIGLVEESTLLPSLLDENGILYTGGGYGGFSGSFDTASGGSILGIYDFEHAGINESGRWALGVQSTLYNGFYSDSTADSWSMNHELSDSFGGYHFSQMLVGNQWSGGEMAGTGYGSWVNWNSAVTGVSGGELQGTFDPANQTWQAAAQWAHVDTKTFLGLVGTPEGLDRLSRLNIPAIEVGRADLAGSNGDITVNMPGTTFFAYSTGDSPRIWGAGNVNGSYGSTVPQPGLNVSLSAPNLGANFQFNNNTLGSTWGANIDGGGTVGGHSIGFSGAAAGNISGNNFSGTASGTAFAPSVD